MVVLDISEINFDITNFKNGINKKNILYDSLENDIMIDDILHVVTFISNICQFKRRFELMKNFIDKMNKTKNIQLYVVEIAYDNQDFQITEQNNPYHLQLRTKDALWHKENMINLAIQQLLPNDWKAVSWVDGDIEFENNDWVINTLKALTKFEIIQPFSLCLDLDENEIPMNIWQSFCYQYCNGKKFTHERGINYWHCGYAWACKREFYEKIGGIYDKSILGSGDYILSQALLGNIASLNKSLLDFKNDIKQHYEKILTENIIIGYIPSTIRHFFHGSKKNRKYLERNEILININYDPNKHITYNEHGILIPTDNITTDVIEQIKQYFFERNDDEYYELLEKNKSI